MSIDAGHVVLAAALVVAVLARFHTRRRRGFDMTVIVHRQADETIERRTRPPDDDEPPAP